MYNHSICIGCVTGTLYQHLGMNSDIFTSCFIFCFQNGPLIRKGGGDTIPFSSEYNDKTLT